MKCDMKTFFYFLPKSQSELTANDKSLILLIQIQKKNQSCDFIKHKDLFVILSNYSTICMKNKTKKQIEHDYV